MSKHSHLLLFLLLTQTSQLYSQAAAFTITEFADSAKSIPASGNEIILPPSNSTTLRQLKEPPHSLNPGQILLRRRFSSKEYGLYQGFINSDAYTHLSAFLLPSKNQLKFITAKFFTEPSENPDNDIENIYFDDGLIYVENKAKLFYYDSVWKKIDMLPDLPARLIVNSEPLGADVYVDGAYSGTTPWNSGQVLTSTAVIQLRKEGFYTQELFVNFFNGEIQQKHVTLNKKVIVNDSTEISPAGIPTENTENIEELEQRIEKLEARIVEQKALLTRLSDSLLKNYPPLSPKDEFEKNAQFVERKQRYEDQKKSDLQLIKDKYQSRIAAISQIILKTVEYKTDLESRIYTSNIQATDLKLGQYDPENECFPFTMPVNTALFECNLTGTITIPVEQARLFKQNPSEGIIKLSYSNKSIKLNNSGQIKRLYYQILSVKLLYKKNECFVKGTIIFPDYFKKSAEWNRVVELKRHEITDTRDIMAMNSTQSRNFCIRKGSLFFEVPLEENENSTDYTVKVEGYPEFNVISKPHSFLKITNVQDGATVYVDDYKHCEIDLYSVLQIHPGTHVVTVSKEGFRTSEFQILAKPEDTVECKLFYAPLPAELSVLTFPDSAYIELNNQYEGRTPDHFNSLEPGEYKIKLVNYMYEPIIRNITLDPGARMFICDTFRNYSVTYKNWLEYRNHASLVNFCIAGLGKTIVNKNGLSISLMAAGVASDALLGYSMYQCYSHSKKMDHSSSATEKNYFSSRRKEDIGWVISTGLFTILDRLLTFKLTRSEVFK